MAPLAMFAVAMLLVLTGCRSPGAVTADSSPASSGSPGPSTGSTTVPGPATAAGCDLAFGSQLRERTTVDAAGRVSILAGDLPCASLGVWLARFSLDEDPSTDPAPAFVGGYTGKALAARIAVTAQPCAAGAVFFAVDATRADATAAALTAARLARGDLSHWPADRAAVVPGGAILAGRGSVVLVGTVTGDPSGCTPGNHVSTPIAAVRDCWLGVDGSPAATGTPAAGTSAGAPADPTSEPDTPFTKVSCDAPHTHEVYWVENLDPKRYLADTEDTGTAASTWARKRAETVCAAKGGSVDLAHDVAGKDIFLEFQWPSTLTYSPATTATWSRAQVVCLARWKDGKPSSRHLLHR
jgi:hypothetical protein